MSGPGDDVLERPPARSDAAVRARRVRERESKKPPKTASSTGSSDVNSCEYSYIGGDKRKEGAHSDSKLDRRALVDDESRIEPTSPKKTPSIRNLPADERRAYHAQKQREYRAREKTKAAPKPKRPPGEGTVRALPVDEQRAYYRGKHRASYARAKSTTEGKARVNAAERARSKRHYERVMANPEKRQAKNNRMKLYLRAVRARKPARPRKPGSPSPG